MIRFHRNSKGTAAYRGMIPSALPAFHPNGHYGYTYDRKRAVDLLDSAGFPGGKGLPVISLAVVPTYRDLAEYVQKELQDIGIRIEIEVVQPAVLRNQVAQGQQVFFRASWVGDYPDAENYMALFYSRYGAPPNYTRYSNPAFDALYERAMNENNDTIRVALYREMDSLVMADAPVVPLYYDEVYRFVTKRVKGLEVNPMNTLDLRRVTISAD
jgi:peptide/nickel transport system substrate-binding protein